MYKAENNVITRKRVLMLYVIYVGVAGGAGDAGEPPGRRKKNFLGIFVGMR